jgi:hypothetical protein
MVIVDADHSYHGAKIDLCTIINKIPNTPVIGFHDYGYINDEFLQMDHPNNAGMIVYGIKKAILDVIGDERTLHPVGEIGSVEKEYAGHDFCYLPEGEHEGVLLFPQLLDRMSFIMANTFLSSY